MHPSRYQKRLHPLAIKARIARGGTKKKKKKRREER
jgi:hypothetical protein